MAKEKINVGNLDTLDIKAKKKKNFIIISVIIVIVTILFISVGAAFLKVDKTKIYKEREAAKAAKDLKLIQNPEFKENWAISIENRMESQEKKTQEVIAEIAGKQDRVLDELKDIIQESSKKNSSDIQDLSNTFDTKIGSLRNELFEQIEAQNQKIEQVATLAQTSKSSSPNSGDIMIGADLTPKNNNSSTVTDQNGLTIVVADGEKEKQDKAKLEADSKDLESVANEAIKNIESSTDVPNAIEETTVTSNQSKKKSIKMIDIDTSFNANIVAAAAQIEDEASKKEDPKETEKNYHLSTGLSQAYMITGAYAPAFQEGEAEPLPVLLEAEGDIIQPNDHLASVDKCFLLGSAKGNMNSQTANIKLVSISCILNEGEYRIEGALSGWVIGENGIPGVHGELIHKNGAWLARTFVSGFLETFANAIGGGNTSTINLGTDTNENSRSNSYNDTGTTTSINNNLATAGAQGISTVFNKLGDYYLKMAEQIFPVIEVRGGRTVDILLIGGEDLTIVENNKVDLANINDHLSELSLKKDKEADKITNTNPFTKSILNDSGKGQPTSENEVPEPIKK